MNARVARRLVLPVTVAALVLAGAGAVWAVHRPRPSSTPAGAARRVTHPTRPTGSTVAPRTAARSSVRSTGRLTGAAPTVPPTTAVAPPPPPGGSPWRVLVVGDSTAMTLWWALFQTAPTYHAEVFDAATFMCGVAIGTEASSDDGQGPTMSMVPACNSDSPASAQWPALWRDDLARYDPQLVVVLAGRWETTDRMYEGRWMDILDPPFAAYVGRQLVEAGQVGTSTGAHVDLLTSACADSAPFFASLHAPDSAVNDDSSRRLAVYNALVRRAAAQVPGASVVDFDALLCPGGQFHRTLDGVQVRPLDGVHTPSYSPGNTFLSNSTAPVAAAFAAWLGPRLWPELLAPLAAGSTGSTG